MAVAAATAAAAMEAWVGGCTRRPPVQGVAVSMDEAPAQRQGVEAVVVVAAAAAAALLQPPASVQQQPIRHPARLPRFQRQQPASLLGRPAQLLQEEGAVAEGAAQQLSPRRPEARRPFWRLWRGEKLPAEGV